MVEIYSCFKELMVEEYSEEEVPTGEYKFIDEGTLWERDDSINYLGGEVHLESRDKSGWLEVPYSVLESHFVKVDEINE